MEMQVYLEEYKIRVDYLNKHYARLWQRFNYFIPIELALFSFAGWLDSSAQIASYVKFVGPIGIVISLLWFFLAFQDRELVKRYKRLALLMLEKLAPELIPHSSIDPKKEFISDKYIARISLTKFPMVLALVFLIIWAIFLTPKV